MDILYTWQVDQMQTKPQEGNLLDVVSTISWRRFGSTIVNDVTFVANDYGLYYCPSPSETDFTAYADLTLDEVSAWLEAGLDVPSIDADIAVKLELLINPPLVVLPNPWDVPTPDTSGTSGRSGTSGTSGS